MLIVVGSGIAGLIAALETEPDARRHAGDEGAAGREQHALCAGRDRGGDCSADDSVAEHVADTLRAGAGLCDVEAVEVLCAEGPAADDGI